MSPKNQRSEGSRYEDLFVAFSQRVEKIIAVLLAVMLAALLVSQALLLIPGIRQRIVKVERLEGFPYTHAADS
jgi:hypothetical protein